MDDLEQFLSTVTSEDLKRYIRVTEELLVERNRVLDAVPECPVHGPQCVPHALEWIKEKANKQEAIEGN